LSADEFAAHCKAKGTGVALLGDSVVASGTPEPEGEIGMRGKAEMTVPELALVRRWQLAQLPLHIVC
jgi:hypothetical protein